MEQIEPQPLITREDLLEIQDPEQLMDLRRNMAAIALNALSSYYEVHDILVAQGYADKSRKKRITELDV